MSAHHAPRALLSAPLLRAAGLALLLGSAGCLGPRPGPAPPGSAHVPARAPPYAAADSLRAAPRSAPAPVRMPLTVDVLLAEGRREQTLHIAGSAAGSLTLQRSGDGLRAMRGNGPGPHLGAELWLQPAAGSAGLEFEGQTYAGRLLVRPARRGAGLEVLNRVELEEYVTGVLSAELSMWSAQPAELEAQAIACRTFAVHELATPRPYLFADTRDQVYRGRPPAASAVPVSRATTRTRGEVLAEDGRLLAARYHAACGGDTARGELVFPGLRSRCLASVECAPCRAHEGPIEAALGSGDTWRVTLDPEDLELLALELEIGDRLTAFEPASVDPAGRWLSVRFDGPRGSAVMSFEQLRGLLGPTRLKSARVVRTWPRAGAPIARDGGLFIEGRGRGHGVGLCQTGARGYARRGWSAARILAHYYRGAQLTRGTP